MEDLLLEKHLQEDLLGHEVYVLIKLLTFNGWVLLFVEVNWNLFHPESTFGANGVLLSRDFFDAAVAGDP
jgi:hypothetical protein